MNCLHERNLIIMRNEIHQRIRSLGNIWSLRSQNIQNSCNSQNIAIIISSLRNSLWLLMNPGSRIWDQNPDADPHLHWDPKMAKRSESRIPGVRFIPALFKSPFSPSEFHRKCLSLTLVESRPRPILRGHKRTIPSNWVVSLAPPPIWRPHLFLPPSLRVPLQSCPASKW